MSHASAATNYARQVIAGEIDVCKFVKLSCQRQLDDLERYEDGKGKFLWNPELVDRKRKSYRPAERICNFAQSLHHIKGKWEGSLIKLEPWQQFIFCVLFGWIRAGDKTRRYREAYIEVPRKNSKSTMDAIVGLYCFGPDYEPGSEVYSGATSEKQAMEVFKPARLMALKNPEFCDFYGIEVNAASIVITGTASTFMPVIGKPGDGAMPHCAITDEYHEHPDSSQYDTMKTGMAARMQPIRIITTTAGSNMAGPCYTKRDQVIKILEGVFDNDEIFGIIYTIDKGDKWTDFKVWKKANPNYNVSVFADYLESRLKEAEQNASDQFAVKCKHLNIWEFSKDPFFNIELWKQCGDNGIKMQDCVNSPCYLGLNLSSRDDIAALTALFRNDDGSYVVFGKFYAPEDALKSGQNALNYLRWVSAGHLESTEGAAVSFGLIEDDIKKLCREFDVQEVDFDPLQAEYLEQRLQEEGILSVKVSSTSKNYSAPMKELKVLIANKQIKHDGNPVLTWMLSSVVPRYDRRDNVFPSKEAYENKIDGAVALIMSLGRAMVFRSAVSVYANPETAVM